MIPSELLEAYRATRYRIALSRGAGIDLIVGRRSPTAERLLASVRARSGAFITAFNPGSQRRSDAENFAAQRALERDVRQLRRPFWRGVGVGADGSWPPELSVFIAGITRAAALRLARKYRQLAFVYERAGARVALVTVPPRQRIRTA